jgi:GH43 family beta-xylosidase
MHWINGKWWIYFTADNGSNNNHRVFVLEGRSTEPIGGFNFRGVWRTDGWAIDPTIFTGKDGQLYALWSGWPGASDGQQNLYISRMRDPATLIGARVKLTSPTEAWERSALPVCEGPEVLTHNGMTFVVYSASGSWTADYCLGLLVNRDGNYLNPNSWQKESKPVLSRTDRVWGVGHCCFLSTKQTGDLLFYHAKTKPVNGWGDRNVRVQPFRWRNDGLPDFGRPIAPELPVAIFAP